MKITRLSSFIVSSPALADSPIGIVNGKTITPRTALQMLQRGQNVNSVINALAVIGVDPPEQDWILVEQYYRELLAKPGKKPNIYVIPEGKVTGEQMTIDQALAHIRARDAVGRSLLQSYQGYLAEISTRMRKA